MSVVEIDLSVLAHLACYGEYVNTVVRRTVSAFFLSMAGVKSAPGDSKPECIAESVRLMQVCPMHTGFEASPSKLSLSTNKEREYEATKQSQHPT